MVRFNVRNVLTMEIFRQKGSDMEEKHQTLKELPVSERPYEKCENNYRKTKNHMKKLCSTGPSPLPMQSFWQ